MGSSELLERSDVVVCSSDELAARAVERGARRARTVIVPNGWDEQRIPDRRFVARCRATGPLELLYFGTIAPWLDVDALRARRDARCPTYRSG